MLSLNLSSWWGRVGLLVGCCACHDCGLWAWLWACAAIWDKFKQDSRVICDQKYLLCISYS